MTLPTFHWHAPIAKQWLREIYSNHSDSKKNISVQEALIDKVSTSFAYFIHNEAQISLGILFSLHYIVMKSNDAEREKILSAYRPVELYFLIMIINYTWHNEAVAGNAFPFFREQHGLKVTVEDEIAVLKFLNFQNQMTPDAHNLNGILEPFKQQMKEQNKQLTDLRATMAEFHEWLSGFEDGLERKQKKFPQIKEIHTLFSSITQMLQNILDEKCRFDDSGVIGFFNRAEKELHSFISKLSSTSAPEASILCAVFNKILDNITTINQKIKAIKAKDYICKASSFSHSDRNVRGIENAYQVLEEIQVDAEYEHIETPHLSDCWIIDSESDSESESEVVNTLMSPLYESYCKVDAENDNMGEKTCRLSASQEAVKNTTEGRPRITRAN